MFPAQQLLIWDILRKLHISMIMFPSQLNQDKRDEIVYDFNESEYPIVLICSPSTVSYGLNLQMRCDRNFHLDEPMGRQLRAQQDGRQRGIGTKGDLLSYSVSMKKTFHDHQIQNNLGKSLPGIMSELNTSIFDIGTATIDDQTAEISVGNWVIIDNILISTDDLSPDNYLEPTQVLRKMLRDERGD